ncbi:MAG: type II toxin-antitoxin system VapC family toxin [Actinobacteria bacterium]|nr:type II toxin-antitoxin system VapC family toxin [Actinomycetota bacterium]
MADLVLDASANVDTLLDTATGRALQQLLQPQVRWWVSDHYFAEVSGTLRRLELHGEILPAQAPVEFAELCSAPLAIARTRPMLGDAWRRRGHLTIADALDVVLAEHLDAALVTTDGKVARSPGLGVPTISA